MTKIRISADQISNFKALAKAFSAIIQEKSNTRLRGRTLLNAFSMAAGHSNYNSLLYDAYAYGSGEFRWSTLPAKLSSGLSVQLSMDRFAVLTMLIEATLQVPTLASAIEGETAGAYNPIAGVEHNPYGLRVSESTIWSDIGRSHLSSIAKTGVIVETNLPGLPSPESQLIGRTFDDSVRVVKPDISTLFFDGKYNEGLPEDIAGAMIQAGAVEFCRTDTSDLQSAGDDAAKAVYANANHSVVIKHNQLDSNAGMPFRVYLSDTGMCPEDEQALTESFQKLGNMSVQVSELEAGRLVLDEIRDAARGRSGSDDFPRNLNIYYNEDQMP